MNTAIFLLVVGVLAIALVLVFSRFTRSRRTRDRAARSAHHAKPYYRPATAPPQPVKHTHTGHLPSQAKDVWQARRHHASGEHWATGTFTAHKVRYDNEPPDAETGQGGLAMGVIEFTPEERPAATSSKP